MVLAPGINAECLLLDTDWRTAPDRAARHISDSRPDIVIHLGVSENARHLVLETHAYNACCDTPGVEGTVVSASKLHPDRPASIRSTAPVGKIAEHLENAGHPVTVSDDPGRYLCNAVYHETLEIGRKTNEKTRNVFIHVPVVLNKSTISWEDAVSGLDCVLDAMMAAR